MAKLRIEWPVAFEPYGTMVEAILAPSLAHSFDSGVRTTPSVRAIMDVLRPMVSALFGASRLPRVAAVLLLLLRLRLLLLALLLDLPLALLLLL